MEKEHVEKTLLLRPNRRPVLVHHSLLPSLWLVITWKERGLRYPRRHVLWRGTLTLIPPNRRAVGRDRVFEEREMDVGGWRLEDLWSYIQYTTFSQIRHGLEGRVPGVKGEE